MAVDRSWRWIAWLILGIGGLIAAGGLLTGINTLRHVLYGERTEGVVLAIEREDDMYAPVVRFRLSDGQPVEVKDLGSGAPDFSVGDTVGVLYLPGAPQDFRLDTFERLWLIPLILTCFGGFWLLFGAVAWAMSNNVDIAIVGERAFSVIAVSALLIGVFTLWNAVDLYASGGRARGTVMEIRESRTTVEEVTTSGGREVRREVERLSYIPVVRFKTPEGREIEFHGRGGSDTSLVAGDMVNVVYDLDQPSRARILSFIDLWLPAAVAFAMALLFGGAVRLSKWSRRRS